MFSLRASSLAKRLEAEPVWLSVRPTAGEGVAIEMMPLTRSATAVWISLVCADERRSTSLPMRFSEDSHCKIELETGVDKEEGDGPRGRPLLWAGHRVV